MAFQTKDLSVLAYANGFTLWHYTTGAHAMLRAGDIILSNVPEANVRNRTGQNKI